MPIMAYVSDDFMEDRGGSWRIEVDSTNSIQGYVTKATLTRMMMRFNNMVCDFEGANDKDTRNTFCKPKLG